MQFIRGVIKNERNEVTNLVEGIRLEAYSGNGRTVTYFVRPGGNDSNSGRSPAPENAFATFERALESVPLFFHEETYVIDVTGMGTMSKDGGFFFPPFNCVDTTRNNLAPSFNAFVSEAPLMIRATPTTVDTIAIAELTSQTLDTVTSQRTLNTTKSYLLNEHKGKMVVGAGVGQFAVIASNTAGPASSLEITANFAFTAPILVVTPSAELRNSLVTSTEGAVVLESFACPIVFQGIKLSHANASTLAPGMRSEGCLRQIRCVLGDIAGVSFAGGGTFNHPALSGCYLRGAKTYSFSGSPANVSVSFLEAITWDSRGAGTGYDGTFFNANIARGCNPIGNSSIPNTDSSVIRITSSKIESGTSHGVIGNPNVGLDLATVALRGNAGNGIRLNGGRCNASTVRSTPGPSNTLIGLEATDGSHCTVNSTTDVVGTAGELKVGANATKTWAVFHAGVPPITEVDATVQLARVVQP